MTEDRFERFVRQAGQDYHRPPETPRAEMWAQIEGELAERRKARHPAVVHRLGGRMPSVRWWGLGIAAALLVGIGIGRFLPREPGAAVTIATSDPADGAAGVPATAYRVAATDHLRRVETFLTVFQLEARSGRADEGTIAPAGNLLVTTQLLLDSPASDDVRLRTLLEDVELVLTQIAQYAVGQSPQELEFIDRGMEQRGVLLKLQAAMHAGSAGIQGAL